MDKKIILYGASGHCKVIIDNLISNNYTNFSIIDDNENLNFLSTFKIEPKFEVNFKQVNLIISIGNNKIRKKIVKKNNYFYTNAIHSNAIISKFAEINIGNVIMAGAIINSDAKIGNHCIINTAAIIEHDCIINDYVHISPNATLAGNVTIGEGTHVGIGATIIQGIKIGKWATIGAGAVIIKNVPDFAVVVGNPGKIIKYNSHE